MIECTKIFPCISARLSAGYEFGQVSLEEQQEMLNNAADRKRLSEVLMMQEESYKLTNADERMMLTSRAGCKLLALALAAEAAAAEDEVRLCTKPQNLISQRFLV